MVLGDNFDKFLKLIKPQKDKYINELIILYIRIYTVLIESETNLLERNYNKAISRLKIGRNIAANTSYSDEETFLKRVRSITSEVISWTTRNRRKKNLEIMDFYGALTKIQMAQNICILRILKR